ncbi:MAG: hypothetical protein II008_14330 [Oscillospiraceae bacterium]|nr:hypothetical protein [Oscillospiraceae bacterium]
MGANRQQRRKQMREQMHEWVRTNQMDQVKRLTQNGIGQKDLDECYEKGHEEGFKAGTDKTLKTVYAGVVLELLEAGNSRDEAISFLRNLDDRLIRSIDAGEDIDEVYNKTGVRLMLKEDFDRVREVAE